MGGIISAVVAAGISVLTVIFETGASTVLLYVGAETASAILGAGIGVLAEYSIPAAVGALVATHVGAAAGALGATFAGALAFGAALGIASGVAVYALEKKNLISTVQSKNLVQRLSSPLIDYVRNEGMHTGGVPRPKVRRKYRSSSRQKSVLPNAKNRNVNSSNRTVVRPKSKPAPRRRMVQQKRQSRSKRTR